MLCVFQIVIWSINESGCERFYVSTGADKTSTIWEPTDAGAEMTEEEWNLRVAELNKHQVTITKDSSTEMYHNKSYHPKAVHKKIGLKNKNYMILNRNIGKPSHFQTI